jgi:hypothetical protein
MYPFVALVYQLDKLLSMQHHRGVVVTHLATAYELMGSIPVRAGYINFYMIL